MNLETTREQEGTRPDNWVHFTPEPWAKEQVALTIVIVNWNSGPLLKRCLASIAQSNTGNRFEVVVVDNASTDDSVAGLHAAFPRAGIIGNPSNIGFARACNLGMDVARGRYLLLLNPDTEVAADTLDVMVGFMERTPEAGAAGCRVLNEDGSLQTTCRRHLPRPLTSFLHLSGLLRLARHAEHWWTTLQGDAPHGRCHENGLTRFLRRHEYEIHCSDEFQVREVEALSGAFLLCRTELLRELGGLDEDYFLFGEDLDLCYRINRHGGGVFRIYYVPDTTITHLRGKCREQSPADSLRAGHDAMALFHRKHLAAEYPGILNQCVYTGIRIHYLVASAALFLHRRSRT
ncbi:glycosyltransferase family 2 protein [bacterium]|nr:glycosyltransferase family 2 protein [candidate division CSSED10-310 bacterium]